MEELLRVEGRVQGVGYRAWVVGEAQGLGLTGWVRNAPDGSVEVAVRGDAARVRRFADLLARGPRHARVVRVVSLGAPTSPIGEHFEVRR